MSAVLDAALSYAERGWPVLPLSGKVPLLRQWPQRKTTDPEVIKGWWRTWPDANIGIGSGGGLAVLDVDPRDGGDETLDALLQNAGAELAETPEVLTGGGGRHIYFQAPPGTESPTLGPGLELKAEGRQVVAPPSVHASGRQYVWHPNRPTSLPLAELPTWAAAHSYGGRRGADRPTASHWARVAREGFREGERNDGAASYAGHLLARLEPEEAFELLLAWNRTCNRPPLPEGELSRVFLSIARRDAAQNRGGPK